MSPVPINAGAVTLQREIDLVLLRCWTCGIFWGIERRCYDEHAMRNDSRCPECLHRERLDARKALDHLERRVISLRGTVTRLSRLLTETKRTMRERLNEVLRRSSR